MKIVRFSIILATLALAAAAGTNDGSALRGVACRLDGAARILSGSPVAGTCRL
jgi:hypothetical protein